MEHGDLAVRGNLIDLFPMGSTHPFRIDLDDEVVDAIRIFDPESQRTLEKRAEVKLLPAREFPLDAEAIQRFRLNFRRRFDVDPGACPLYRDLSNAIAPGGTEAFLPLFFDEALATLFDYLPDATPVYVLDGWRERMTAFLDDAARRYEQRRHDRTHPVLTPEEIWLDAAAFDTALKSHGPRAPPPAPGQASGHGATPPPLAIEARQTRPAEALENFLVAFAGRVLFTAESAGRREVLRELLARHGIHPAPVAGWSEFLDSGERACLTIAPLESGLVLDGAGIAVIAESQLTGERVRTPRRRRDLRDTDAVVRSLAELHTGAPVVHADYGVGRYVGLERLTAGGMEGEYLTIAYANDDRLYVPVTQLHRVSRYTGISPEEAPLHRLGGDEWKKARSKAAERARDVAAELLELQARRLATPGEALTIDTTESRAFAAGFPFEETPDQQSAIDAVIADLAVPRPMDRVVCGDVGFGKTEVAMRAAFVAALAGRQVAVLVPTTLLATQHHDNFRDRFADWPLRIECLSRFRSRKEQTAILADLAAGKVDIVIGTHRLLQEDVRIPRLGLLIIDEEHRFGVRHKERLRRFRAQVHLLTLTATPIPRTLSMSLAGLRELSIIATPPAHRHPIQTFVTEWDDALVTEACQREIRRGGQVYFLHNDLETIARLAERVEKLVPEAVVGIAHGQLPERQLERVMLDFHHRRFNVLVCSTIIESGIDVPTANTILIDRADRLGLAQLHQLRGRVGRSHHRAFCFLIIPPREILSADAAKRIEAVESMEDLGAGFVLATHDLEIRGAGELLGEEQSGQIEEIGFALYSELLERAIQALRAGKEPPREIGAEGATEVELGIPVLLPDDYLPDVHARLVLYKRIAAAPDDAALDELKAEIIDRFGPLPVATGNLLAVTALRLAAERLGIRRIDGDRQSVRLAFRPEPLIDTRALIRLIQTEPKRYRLDGKDRLRMTLDAETDAPARIDAARGLMERLTA